MSEFYGYAVRKTLPSDTEEEFWLRQDERRESFLVSNGEPIAFFQKETVVPTIETRLHFQAIAGPKKVLRGITKLVPLIEKALRSGGTKVVFFTSHSSAMARFMVKLGYMPRPDVDGGADGIVMAKELA